MKYNAIIYTRVSTDEQAQRGFSLRHQKEMLERYCEMKDIKIIKHFEDDYSAKNFDRPEWNKLENFVKANKKSIDQILIVKWDRFSRNVEESLGKIRLFGNWGITVNSIEQPLDLTIPDNKLMLTMYLTIPEIENDKISQRTKDAVVRARKEGAYTSKPPFGYKRCRIDDKASMEPDNNSVLVKELFSEVSKDVFPVEKIRKNYSDKGFTMCKQSFYNILKSRLYIGQVKVPEYKGNEEYWHHGLHEPIVDEVTFNKVQQVLLGRNRNTKYPTKRNKELPLRSFLKCGVCGGNLTGSISKGNGGSYGYYHCRNNCKNRIPVEKAHQLFEDDILNNITVNENVIKLYKKVIKDVLNKKHGNQAEQISKLQSQIEQINVDLDTLEDKLISGGIEDATFNRINRRYNNNLMRLKANLMETKSLKKTSINYVDKALQTIANISGIYNGGNYDNKVILLGLLFPKKVVLSKQECRTTEQSKVIELLCRINKGFKSYGTKKAINNDGLSNLAPQVGLEPTTL